MSYEAVLKKREENRRRLEAEAMTEARRLAKLLRARFKCGRIYLFGSLAKGRFHKGSDIDFIVEGLRGYSFFKAYSMMMMESDFSIDLKPFEDLHDDFRQSVLEGGMLL